MSKSDAYHKGRQAGRWEVKPTNPYNGVHQHNNRKDWDRGVLDGLQDAADDEAQRKRQEFIREFVEVMKSGSVDQAVSWIEFNMPNFERSLT